MSTPLTKYWTSPNGARERTTYIVFHHAAFTYAPGDAVRSIYDYHRGKWPAYNACGYHLIVQLDADGQIRVYQVNPHEMQAAGVAGRNHECYHVCCATNFTGTPSDAWLDAGAAALAEAKRRYPNATIAGHREITLTGHDTSCPGPQWSAWKGVLLARVNGLLAPPPDPWAAWGSIDAPVGDARKFGIPQAWLNHRSLLGACLRGERYDIPGRVSRAIFQGGEVRYLKLTDTAPGMVDVLPYPTMLPVASQQGAEENV